VGGDGDEQARHNLRQALVEVRKALGTRPPVLVSDGETVALAASAVDTDVGRFERLVRDGKPKTLAQAVEVYQGELLEGFV
jgi:DNA-binding SARP family transcriptional activator